MVSKLPVSETLRRAIEQSGMSRYKISAETGIDQAALSRFVRGETGLNLETVDALCKLLGLVLEPKGKAGAKKPKR